MSEKLSKQLSPEEAKELALLVERIRKNEPSALQYFTDVLVIKTKRLYRETHDNFDEWCRANLGKSGSAIERGLKALQITDRILSGSARAPNVTGPDLKAVVAKVPQNAILEVGKSKPEKQAETALLAHKISGGKTITVATVQEAAAKLAHRPVPPPVRPNGFTSCYGAPAPVVCAPQIGDPGPLPAAVRQPAPMPYPAAAGLTLGQLRVKLQLLRVQDNAVILFSDDAGITPIARVNYNPALNQLTIE